MLNATGSQSVLLPLSGKKNFDSTDITILKKDRKMLDDLVKSILRNNRLAALITRAWLSKYNYIMIKEADYEMMHSMASEWFLEQKEFTEQHKPA